MGVISKRRVTRNEAVETAVWTQNGAYAPGVVQRPPRAADRPLTVVEHETDAQLENAVRDRS